MKRLKKIEHIIFAGIAYLGALVVVALALLTVTDITGRFLFNLPVQGTFELTANSLAVIAACGIAAATAADEHILVDSLYDKLSPRGKRILLFIAAFAGFVVFSILCWQGIMEVYNSITPHLDTTLNLDIATYPFRIVLVIGFLLSFVAVVLSVIRLITSKTDDKSESESI